MISYKKSYLLLACIFFYFWSSAPPNSLLTFWDACPDFLLSINSHELQRLFPSSFPSKHNTCMSYHTSHKRCLRTHNHTPALRKAYIYPEMGMEWSRRMPYQSMPKQGKCSPHNTIIYYYLLSMILCMHWRSHTIKERKEKIEILLDIYE